VHVPDPAPKNAAAAASTGGPIDPRAGDFLGHPKGLYVLSSTEMWERFSFYSMRGILTLYVVSIVLAKMTAEKGAEFTGGIADQVYGAYMGFVYSAPFIGGMLADRLLGQRRAIYLGGVLMALAHFTLTTHSILVAGLRATPQPGAPPAADIAAQLAQALGGTFRPDQLNWLFFTGLGLLCCGNGFFKPNISTIVGTLYTPTDARRDAAFTIFYMGINVGAWLSSLASGAGQAWGWYLSYLLAGLGMILSLFFIVRGLKWLPGRGLPPAGATLTGRGRLGVPNAVPLTLGILVFVPLAAWMISHPEWVQNLAKIIAGVVLVYLLFECWRGTREEAGRMIAIIVLCIFSMVFWGFYELQGSTIIRFADLHVSMPVIKFEIPSALRGLFEWFKYTDPVFRWEMPTTFVTNTVNPALVIALCIPFAWLWVWLGRKNLEPSTPVKFALGLFQLGLGFLVFWIAAKEAQSGGKASLWYLMLSIFVFTTGELCLSPVGLSMITKLSPARLVGVYMGVWFLSSAVANVITGGEVGSRIQKMGFADVFLFIGGLIIGSAVLLFILTPLLKRLMHGVK
jgi:POT family proton-dependent oligopeptide transporter